MGTGGKDTLERVKDQAGLQTWGVGTEGLDISCWMHQASSKGFSGALQCAALVGLLVVDAPDQKALITMLPGANAKMSRGCNELGNMVESPPSIITTQHSMT